MSTPPPEQAEPPVEATREIDDLSTGVERGTGVELGAAGPSVLVCLPDPDGHLAGARLWSDVDLGEDLALARVDQGWRLRLDDLPVDRLEYVLEVERDGETTSVLDPTNPRRVGSAFGDHSWLPLPGYRPPAWLEAAPVDGTYVDGHLDDTPVGRVDWQVWSPKDAAPTESLPLLLAHDGPEMATLGGLIRYVGVMIAAGRLPSMRVALLTPGERDERYAAHAGYARALCEHVLAALLAEHPSAHRPAILGASLGAVAALHAQWHHPGSFGALFLASGSFFTPELDPQEATYPRWSQITGFVADVAAAATFPTGPGGGALPRASLGCGTAEENLANNESMATDLRRLGLDVGWGTVRDGHCFTCWRDLLDPHLTDLLAATWAVASDDHPADPSPGS